ncbi:MAG: hypothetical protein LEGION0398_MBIBDBAK_00417 [Legionellaceae bacterium]
MELILVLIVAIALLFSAMSYYKKDKFNTELNIIKLQVIQLEQALNHYYHLHYKDDFFLPKPRYLSKPITMAMLQEEGLLPKKGFISVPWVTYEMKISIDTSTDTYYHLWIMATVKQPESIMDYLQKKLNAIPDPENNKNTLAWSFFPEQKTEIVNTSTWIMESALQEFTHAFTLQKSSN